MALSNGKEYWGIGVLECWEPRNGDTDSASAFSLSSQYSNSTSVFRSPGCPRSPLYLLINRLVPGLPAAKILPRPQDQYARNGPAEQMPEVGLVSRQKVRCTGLDGRR